MNRAFPFTVRVAAVEAAVRLLFDFIFGKWVIDFYKLLGAFFHIFLVRVVTIHINKLKNIV